MHYIEQIKSGRRLQLSGLRQNFDFIFSCRALFLDQ